MREYIIITDSTTDLPDIYAKEYNLKVIPLGFVIDGKTYKNYLDHRQLSSNQFYNMIADGKIAKTSQINPDEFYNEFKEALDEGYDILGIFFSSGLSGTFNSARIARDQILSENPNASIIIIDSLCASLGEGLLVHYAIKAKEDGMSLIENAKYIEELKFKIAHWFTVMDMDILKRGGRISAGTAFFAKTLNIHPVMHVSNEGKLIAKMKKIGRKGALNALVDKMVETYVKSENDFIFISHSNAMEDVNKLIEMIKERTGIDKILVNEVGPVIGGHCGIGTIALFYIASER